MAKKPKNIRSDAPDADQALSSIEEELDGLDTDGDGADDDGDADPDDEDSDPDGDGLEDLGEGETPDLDAELAHLEAENKAALDKADPPPAEPRTEPIAAKVDPAVEREKLIGMLMPDVKRKWGHLELRSVGRQTLEIPLTETELLDTARKINDCRTRLAALERREARLKQAIKAARGAIEADQDTAFDRFNSGKEERILHVATFLDYDEGRAVTVRQDTAEVVKERALTVEERQTQIVPRPVEVEPAPVEHLGG